MGGEAQEELRKKAIAYINSDSTGKGWLGMSGSHSLQAFVNEVARDVDDPHGSGTSVLEAKRTRLDRTGEDGGRARPSARRHDIAIDALGSGSDYTAFLDHLQIASLDLGFGGDDGGGIYHSIYDSFHWYTSFSDGTFVHGAALSKTIGTALLRLADAEILPFEFNGSTDALRQYVDEIEKLAASDPANAGGRLDLAPLRAAIVRLSKSAADYERAAARVPGAGNGLAKRPELAELNRTLYTTERAFRYEAGLPRRPWFKHLGTRRGSIPVTPSRPFPVCAKRSNSGNGTTPASSLESSPTPCPRLRLTSTTQPRSSRR